MHQGLGFAKEINKKDPPFQKKMSGRGLELHPKLGKIVIHVFCLLKNVDNFFSTASSDKNRIKVARFSIEI